LSSWNCPAHCPGLVNDCVLEALFCEIWRKPPLLQHSFVNFEEASHETIILEAFPVKIAGRLARNARFGCFFFEICKRLRAKRSLEAFSRMRSEGFPFIVGVWGWTCVRVVFLVSSSCRRRVVVASSSPTR